MQRWLKSKPTSPGFAPENIDAENGILKDVVMAQEGEAKGHGVFLDREFIDTLVSNAKATYSATGLKARLDHPGASETTMGTQLGYFTNFRKREKDGKMQAIADLQLLDAAEVSPTRPQMRTWVIKMAQEAPDQIMSSIVFTPGRQYQKKNNNHKVYVNELIGDEWVSQDENLGEVYIEMKALHFCDLVEQGAATEALFSSAVNEHLFVVQGEKIAQSNPKLINFLKDNPEKLTAFLERIGIVIEVQKQESMSTIPNPVTLSIESLAKELADAKAEGRAELQAELDASKVELSDAKKTIEDMTGSLSTMQDTLKSLAAKVEEMGKEPIVDPAGGDVNTPAPPEKIKAYDRHPLTIRARKMQNS